MIEGHFTITKRIRDHDYDHGPCEGLYIAELGYTVWFYDNDPTRISFDVWKDEEEDQ